MSNHYIIDSGCTGCVFYQNGCVLGRQRPWNAARCDDFRPYCLVCDYPDFFCNTCRNSSLKRFKPGGLSLLRAGDRLDLSEYSCVWQPLSH